MSSSVLLNICYLASAVLFIFGLKFLGSPQTARKGNTISAVGMALAIIATLTFSGTLSWGWIMTALVIGSFVGTFAAKKIEMTEMPEMVALLNGLGGISSLLLGYAAYHQDFVQIFHSTHKFTALTIYLSAIIGGVTFSGSIVAWGKLKGIKYIPSKPYQFPHQKIVNAANLALLFTFALVFIATPLSPTGYTVLILACLLSLALGVLAVLPIGGADMPVVISLLNSYSGLAACAAGFAVNNYLLIVAGALVGASGIILTGIMCKAMNRSLFNVLFSGFGSETIQSVQNATQGEVKPISASDAYYLLEASKSVLFVPGYGMAVAQAQHVVRELGEILEQNGCEVKYAIHPVAGRMPGHMNVLLAEANVSYDLLVEPDNVNPQMETIDVAIVIGANDVVNPSAREDKSSPIYGMPIIDVDKARTVFVLKRSMNAGFSGLENPLFFKENTRMLFGDAKASIQGLVSQFKEEN